MKIYYRLPKTKILFQFRKWSICLGKRRYAFNVIKNREIDECKLKWTTNFIKRYCFRWNSIKWMRYKRFFVMCAMHDRGRQNVNNNNSLITNTKLKNSMFNCSKFFVVVAAWVYSPCLTTTMPLFRFFFFALFSLAFFFVSLSIHMVVFFSYVFHVLLTGSAYVILICQ